MNKYTLRQTPLAATIGTIFASGSLQAAVITVDTVDDPGLASECSLRAAIQAANDHAPVNGCAAGTAGHDEIVFTPELAHSVITLSGGEIPVTGALTITGPVPGDSSGIEIDGYGNGRIFHIHGNTPGEFEVRLDSLTLLDGQTKSVEEHGGALLARQADLTLENVTVRHSATQGEDARGGGVAVISGDVALLYSTIYANRTQGAGAHGGGLYVRDGNATLNHSQVTGSYTLGDGAHGGGMAVKYGDTTLTDSSVGRNFTEGAYAYAGGLAAGPGHVTLAGSAIYENFTEGSYGAGGGLFASQCLEPDVDPKLGMVVCASYLGAGEVTLTESTVSGNRTGGYAGEGGGLVVVFGDLALNGSQVSGNSTHGDFASAGGLALALGKATLTGSTVTGNFTTGDSSRGAGLGVNGDAELVDSVVSGNSTTGSRSGGGGIILLSGDLQLIDSEVLDNSTAGYRAYGGGLAIYAAGVTLSGGRVAGNHTAGESAFGGGLHVVGGEATLNGTTIAANYTSAYEAFGGGMCLRDSEATINGSTISDNRTEGAYAHGAGLAAVYSDLVLVNSTVSGNAAQGQGSYGGGIHLYAAATLTHSTVAFNSAASGAGGVYNYSIQPLNLYNSLIVQDAAGGPACHAAASNAVNALVTDASCTGTATDAGEIALEPLADNGGPTETHALADSSAAIGAAGDCVTEHGIDTDQRGAPRPGFGSAACDIGAFELHVAPEIALSPGMLDFLQVRAGTPSAPMTVTVESTGNADLKIGAVGALSGGDADAFSIETDGCGGMTLAPGQTCGIDIIFTPGATGSFNAFFEIASNAPTSPERVDLAGIGVAPAVSLSTPVLKFGAVPVGDSALPMAVTVGNAGDHDLTMGTAGPPAGTDPGPFSISSDGCAGTTLAPGGNCDIQVVFSPGAAASFNAFIDIVSDADTSPDRVFLIGSGVEAGNVIFSDRFENHQGD